MVPEAGRPAAPREALHGESAEEGRERAREVWVCPRLLSPRGDQGGLWCSGWLASASCTELLCPGQSSFLDSSRPLLGADGLASLSLWPACNLPGGPLSRDMQEQPLGRLGVFQSSAWPSGVLEDSAA